MDEIVSMIMTNGVGAVLVAYFIYRDFKFTDKITSTLDKMQELLTILKERSE